MIRDKGWFWSYGASQKNPISGWKLAKVDWIIKTGDVNANDKIDLCDAILALQVISGMPVSNQVHKGADVNGDNRLGLAMTWAGARGQTEAQMADTLHLELHQERFHPTLNALNIDLNSRDDQPPPSGDPFSLNIVNALWSRIGYPFLPSYLEVITRNYDAGVRVLDFVNSWEGSRETINQWVEDQTHEKIVDLLPQGSITPDTAVVLTNAIYFKGSCIRSSRKNRPPPALFTGWTGRR